MFIESIICGVSYRIRGGMGNETVRRELKKPEGWEIPNGVIRSLWCLCITLLLPISWISPFIFALAYAGVAPGYFGGKFDLTNPDNRNIENYVRLSARGAFLLLPLATAITGIYCYENL